MKILFSEFRDTLVKGLNHHYQSRVLRVRTIEYDSTRIWFRINTDSDFFSKDKDRESTRSKLSSAIELSLKSRFPTEDIQIRFYGDDPSADRGKEPRLNTAHVIIRLLDTLDESVVVAGHRLHSYDHAKKKPYVLRNVKNGNLVRAGASLVELSFMRKPQA